MTTLSKTVEIDIAHKLRKLVETSKLFRMNSTRSSPSIDIQNNLGTTNKFPAHKTNASLKYIHFSKLSIITHSNNLGKSV